MIDENIKRDLANVVSHETVTIRLSVSALYGGRTMQPAHVPYPDAYRIVEQIERALERLGYDVVKKNPA